MLGSAEAYVERNFLAMATARLNVRPRHLRRTCRRLRPSVVEMTARLRLRPSVVEMIIRRVPVVVIALALVLCAHRARAADPKAERDAQALQKAAIEEDNLNVNYPAAIKKLQTAIAKCGGNRCGPALRGTLLRDLGAMQVMNGNTADARLSFGQALGIDPLLELDPAYKNAQIEQVWDDTKKKGATGAPPTPAPAPAAPAAPAAAPASTEQPTGDFAHTPPLEELVRTPLPVFAEYTGSEPVVRVVTKYKAPGSAEWRSLDMQRVHGGWGAVIPCIDIVTLGTMQYYIQGFNAANDPVATAGNRTRPFSVPIKAQIAGAPPGLPGQEAPKQCEETVGAECPPDFPGCNDRKASGEACTKDGECKSNQCTSGSCVDKKARDENCENDDECASGQCTDGKCTSSKKGAGEECSSDTECEEGPCKDGVCAAIASKGFQRFWVGIAGSLDFFVVPSVVDVCKLNQSGTAPVTPGDPYSCLDPSTSANFPGTNPNTNAAINPSGPGTGDQVAGGFARGNLRVMLSFDYAFTPNVLLGARIGYVLFTDPATVNPTAAFPPLHIEARVTYLIGKNAIMETFAPMVFAGAGVGEFDAFLPVPVSFTNGMAPQTENAWLTAGPVFVAPGAGVRVLLSKKVAATGAAKLDFAFGGSAGLLFGVAPELGLQAGF